MQNIFERVLTSMVHRVLERLYDMIDLLLGDIWQSTMLQIQGSKLVMGK